MPLEKRRSCSPFFTTSIAVQTTNTNLPSSDGWMDVRYRKRFEPL